MRRYASVAAVLALLVAHVGWPGRIPLDWQSIVLVGAILGLVFAPELLKILPYIKRFKVGSAEFEMWESLKKLNKQVTEAEEAPVEVRQRVTRNRRPEAGQTIENTEDHILALATRDKEAALVKLTIEIERAVSTLFQVHSPQESYPRSMRESVRELVSRGILSNQTGAAIMDFWAIRNKVVHAGLAKLDEPILTSTIDSGLRILRLLQPE